MLLTILVLTFLSTLMFLTFLPTLLNVRPLGFFDTIFTVPSTICFLQKLISTCFICHWTRHTLLTKFLIFYPHWMMGIGEKQFSAAYYDHCLPGSPASLYISGLWSKRDFTSITGRKEHIWTKGKLCSSSQPNSAVGGGKHPNLLRCRDDLISQTC